LAAFGVTLISALAAAGMAYWLKTRTAQRTKSDEPSKGIPARLFRDWGKPDFVIVLSAQQHGYMLPCGCSEPQVGGLERRYNFMQMLKAKGWPIVAVDLGDVPQKSGPAKLPNVQGLLKYRYSMMALKEMGYLAVGVGEYEAALSLARVEGEWAARFPQPAVLAANLKGDRDQFAHFKAGETQTVPGSNIKVGVTSVVGPRVANRIRDPAIEHIHFDKSLREQWKAMRDAKVDLPILLYHGTLGHNSAASDEDFPDFPLILALSEAEDPPDSSREFKRPGTNTRTYLFHLGQKGKYVGVVGVYRNDSGFAFKYQLVKMDLDYVTPPERADEQPIVKMMEDYTRELKNENYLKKYDPRKHVLQELIPLQPGDATPTYIGSEACGKCHEYAYKVWKQSKHSHAYKTLVDAKHPSLRQYDGECIVCHTVGFGYEGGFANERDTPKLENVGCESCHGPGSLHKLRPNDKGWRNRMNLPWLEARQKSDVKAKNRAIEKFCVTCHDTDNDVNWIHGAHDRTDPFLEKWQKRKIVHDTPAE
jgi:hypothetical protein